MPRAKSADILENGQKSALLHHRFRPALHFPFQNSADGRSGRNAVQLPDGIAERLRRQSTHTDQTETGTPQDIGGIASGFGRCRSARFLFADAEFFRRQTQFARLLFDVVLDVVVELFFARLQGVHLDANFEIRRQTTQLDQIGEPQRSVLLKKFKFC